MSEIVWQSTLDQIYDCRVTRTGDYRGTLTVTDTKASNCILEKEVGLSYGSMFGPDVSDVALWQDFCCEAVDRQNK